MMRLKRQVVIETHGKCPTGLMCVCVYIYIYIYIYICVYVLNSSSSSGGGKFLDLVVKNGIQYLYSNHGRGCLRLTWHKCPWKT